MASRLRIKVGDTEMELEGSEEFVKDELPHALTALSELRDSASTKKAISNTTAAASGWARGYVTIGAGSTDIGGASDRASA
jgi:hypothetical protein